MKGLNYQNIEEFAKAQRDSFTVMYGTEMFSSMTTNSVVGKFSITGY